MIFILRKSWTTQEEHWKSGESQRFFAKSPRQSTRTVQAGGDPVQVVGLKLKRKTIELCSKQDHENTIVESQRIRTLKRKEKTHQDQIADRGQVSMSHYNMVHKPIPTPTTMKILEARTAVDEDWTKLQKQPAWDESNVTNNAEVIQRANFEGKTVHFCNIDGLVSSQEFWIGEQFQDYEGRVGFWEVILWTAIPESTPFTEQGALASLMTAAKVVISRLPDWSGRASGAVSAYTQVKMRDTSETLSSFGRGLSKNLDQNTESKKTTTLGFNCRSSSFAVAQYFRSPILSDQLHKVSCFDDHQRKPDDLESVGESSEICSQIVMLVLGKKWKTKPTLDS